MTNTMKKLEELVSSNAKLAELLHLKKEEEIEKKNTALYVFAIIGAVAAIALIAYAVYRYLNPVYVEDDELEDEYEELFEDDYIPNAASEADFEE
ncbi:MAG: DUF4366 domain-containing protein [Lachnospiraceae bacterium]|nr:DUF4366 domain-containing protein [Lachnospiraceae bacterium]MBQ8547881.1 DUF4366 domain-containing protein [Lachnospiraceae bacterium]